MTTLDKIRTAQRDAGEAAVIANLQRIGLTTTDTDTIPRLQGEARVMLDLLSEALGVIDTIEPECATEQELLDALKDNILAVLVAKGGWPK